MKQKMAIKWRVYKRLNNIYDEIKTADVVVSSFLKVKYIILPAFDLVISSSRKQIPLEFKNHLML